MLPAVPGPVPMIVHLHMQLCAHAHTHVPTDMHTYKLGLELHLWKFKDLKKLPFSSHFQFYTEFAPSFTCYRNCTQTKDKMTYSNPLSVDSFL